MKIFPLAVAIVLPLLSSCGGSPGALEGTWRASGPLPMTITFRPDETEAMGIIEHVNYKTEGNTVQVTYKDGMMKGSSIRFVLVDHNTATNPMYTLRRVR